MLEEQAENTVELPHQADGKYLEHPYCESVRAIYQTIHSSGLYKFTFSWVDSLWKELTSVVFELEHVPQETMKELLEVIERLTEARNELRLARFLFRVEEINPLYRLVMRNRAILRGERVLDKVIQVWPLRPLEVSNGFNRLDKSHGQSSAT